MPTTARGLRYPAGSAAPNVPLDLANLAADVQDEFDGFNVYLNSYTPTLTATTTNPVLGSGSTAKGWYNVQDGDMVDYTFLFVFGTSGSSAGTGQYLVSLPFAAVGNFGTAWPEVAGCGFVRDNSAAIVNQANWYIPGSNLAVVAGIAQNSVINNVAPWAWQPSDYIQGTIRYRAA